MRRISLTLAAAAALAAGALGGGAAPASAAGTTFDVNPVTGKDSNASTAAAPFRTIGHALDLAKAGDTVRLAGGQYTPDTNGKQYTTTLGAPRLVVQSGVTIQGQANASLGRTILTGTDNVGLHLTGDATIRDLFMSRFTKAVQADKGTQTLRGVDLSSTRLALAGTANMTYQASVADPRVGERGGIMTRIPFNAVAAVDSAQFTLDRGVISGGTPNCNLNAVGLFATNSAKLTVRNGARLENIAGGGIVAVSSAKVAIADSTISTTMTAPCDGRPAVEALGSSLIIDRSTLSSNKSGQSVGIKVDTNPQVLVRTSTLEGWGRAAILTGKNQKTVVAQGVVICNSLIGINALASPAAVVDVALSRLEDNTIGIDGGAPKLRFATVRRNPGGGVILAHAFHDLGTAASRGHNVFQDNGPNGSVRFASGVRGTIAAVGNTWNPNAQGADAQGGYGTGPVSVPGSSPQANGTNFRVPADGSAILL